MARTRPDWLAADLAILLEPTSGQVEAGCQGTLRAAVVTGGRRAHSARSWLGVNAVHAAAPVLARLAAYEPRSVEIDGCTYREGLNAVGIARRRRRQRAAGRVRGDGELPLRPGPVRGGRRRARAGRSSPGWPRTVSIVDSAPGALPGLDAPAARDFVAAVGAAPVAKYGWTDVSRFAALGIPAVNFGPGDPNLAHTREEHVLLPRIADCEAALRAYLTRPRLRCRSVHGGGARRAVCGMRPGRAVALAARRDLVAAGSAAARTIRLPGDLAAAPPPSATVPAAQRRPPPVRRRRRRRRSGALPAYRALVADWQRSRSRFFAAVSDGRSRTVGAAARAGRGAPGRAAPLRRRVRAASGVLAGHRPAAAVRRAARRQRPPAGPPGRDDPRRRRRPRSPPGSADYGVGVAAEEQAIRAVERALAGERVPAPLRGSVAAVTDDDTGVPAAGAAAGAAAGPRGGRG